MLASLSLRVLHLFYFLAVLLSNIWQSFERRKPKHLAAERTKVPSHLALILVTSEDIDAETTEKSFVECIARAVTWCQAVGIRQFSVYDCEGVAVRCSQVIRMRLIADRSPCEQDSDSELEYPLTPPLSDTSELRPLSPDYDIHLGVITMRVADIQASKLTERTRRRNVLKRRRPKYHAPDAIPLTIHLVSRESSKPAIASVARSYVQTVNHTARNAKAGLEFKLSPKELASALEGRHGLPSPDFMIVHHITRPRNNQPSLELHGFPPWQIQLTELYVSRPLKLKWSWLRSSASTSLLEEEQFRAALDEFASVETRFGK